MDDEGYGVENAVLFYFRFRISGNSLVLMGSRTLFSK